jgi:hypothetical protein
MTSLAVQLPPNLAAGCAMLSFLNLFLANGLIASRVPQASVLSLSLANTLIASYSSTSEPRPTTPPAGCPTVRGFPNRGSSDPSESALTPTRL